MARPLKSLTQIRPQPLDPNRSPLEQEIAELHRQAARLNEQITRVATEATRAVERAVTGNLGNPDYVSTRWVKQQTSLPPTTINGLLKNGELEGVKFGSRWLVSRASYDAFIRRLQEGA